MRRLPGLVRPCRQVRQRLHRPAARVVEHRQDDPVWEVGAAAPARAEGLLRGPLYRAGVAPIRLGTCSWADRGLLSAWYPPSVRDAAARLGYYAERFDVVEVDSPFYRLPTPETTARWAERTPPGFRFHVKASAEMTGHREADRDEAFRAFRAAAAPLEASGKLRAVLLQYPPWLAKSREAARAILEARDLLDPLVPLVEFRHASWTLPEELETTLSSAAGTGSRSSRSTRPGTRSPASPPRPGRSRTSASTGATARPGPRSRDLRRALRLALHARGAGRMGARPGPARGGGRRGLRALQQQPRRLRAAERAAPARPARRGGPRGERRHRAGPAEPTLFEPAGTSARRRPRRPPGQKPPQPSTKAAPAGSPSHQTCSPAGPHAPACEPPPSS